MMLSSMPPNWSMKKPRTWRSYWTISKWDCSSEFLEWLIAFIRWNYSILYLWKESLKHLIHLKAFNYVDSEGNHVITKEDFTKDDTVEVLEHWLGPNEDWEEEFDNIDLTNKKGEGNVLFRVSDPIRDFCPPTKYMLPCLTRS